MDGFGGTEMRGEELLTVFFSLCAVGNGYWDSGMLLLHEIKETSSAFEDDTVGSAPNCTP